MSAPDGTVARTPAFGTFAGVFRPTALTVLGAMLYLREGWLVGNAGLLGGLAIVLGAAAITGLTTLSLSSIATNTRVKAGGAFAIIAQALGLEAGGAIGMPLWIAQTLSATMYLFAFSEAWQVMFPSHPGVAVAVAGFWLVALLAWRSANLAFKAQSVMFVVVCVALVSVAGGLLTAEALHTPQLLGRYPHLDRGQSFALFFPGLTGIMVGVGMSGALRSPRRSLPRGTLAAWGVTLGIYVLGALWYAVIAPPEVLLTQKTVMIERAAVPSLVLGGLLVSTLMAALSSLVAAPRLLAAMAGHGVVPRSSWLAQLAPDGEPRNAMAVTLAVAGAGLLAGSLDAIAPIITSFFIMTYLSINLVVWVEQVLGMVSWRPLFRVPQGAPLLGVLACLAALSLASPFGGAVEVLVVIGIYAVLSRRQLETPWETVRSGVLVSLGAWAARKVAHVQRSERAWRPDLLVPLASPDQGLALLPLVHGLTVRNGSVRWLGVGRNERLPGALPALARTSSDRGVFATTTILETDQVRHGLGLAMDTLRGSLFPPNLALVDATRIGQADLDTYVQLAEKHELGLALWFPAAEDEQEAPRRSVAVWLSDRSPSWDLKLHTANLDLPILAGWLLSTAWESELHLHTVVKDPEHRAGGEAFLRHLRNAARLRHASAQVLEGEFLACLAEAPPASLHVFGVAPNATLHGLEAVAKATGHQALFLLDSGRESALA